MSVVTQLSSEPALRLGARVLLLDPCNRVLLIHARDPDDPAHHWWELPGGGINADEAAYETARRELAEETGIVLDQLGPCLWVRETRFWYRGRDHHRREAAYLGCIRQTEPRLRLKRTANEMQGMLEYKWWTQPGLACCTDKLLPPNLPQLLADILNNRWHGTLELDR
jgi:8-oxo-dGTP pyrophosphatase MutT (NUDIX family)